jgi:hypothetical protein
MRQMQIEHRERREEASAERLEHTVVEITDSAQESSSDEEQFASWAKTIFSLGGAGRARLGSRPRGANFEGRGRPAEGCQTARGTEKSEQAHGALHAVLLRQQSQLGSLEGEVAAAAAW